MSRRALCLLALLPVLGLLTALGLTRHAPPDAAWMADAELSDVRLVTLDGVGAAQGVARHNGKLYVYGDVYDANPRVGVVREYADDLTPTGRAVWLRKSGRPLLRHPTGLTWHPEFGCFLGDTVDKKATIYHLDWDRALADGHLDGAVKAVIADDAAINGCRPEFVALAGRPLLATADYGDIRPEVRLYDPAKLLAAGRSRAAGVVAHRVPAGPFNQTLAWDAAAGQLTCVQNVIAGRGWRLDVLDLSKAVAEGRADGPSVRVRRLTFPPRDELEGYIMLDGGRGLFVTSSGRNNATTGVPRAVAPRP